VGHAEDLNGRLDDVKRHVPEEILDEQWRIAFQQRWRDSISAYDMEQEIFKLLSERRTRFERIKCGERELETAWTAAVAAVRARLRPDR